MNNVNNDLISRQQAIDAVKKNTFKLKFVEEQNYESSLAWSTKAVYSDLMEEALLDLPSAQPDTINGDYISRQAALNLFPDDNLYWDTNEGYFAPHYARTKLMTLPLVQPEHKVGKWIRDKSWSEGAGMGESYGHYWKCNQCNNIVKGDWSQCGDNFCSNCGADMRGNKDEIN